MLLEKCSRKSLFLNALRVKERTYETLVKKFPITNDFIKALSLYMRTSLVGYGSLLIGWEKLREIF